MKYLIAILALALLGSTAEAHGGRQFRQRVVVQQVVVQRQHFHAQQFVQPIVVRQQFVQPIYSQQFVAPVYSQQFVQPVVVGHSCGALTFGY
jgi:hypothetical protein